jgi:hypothetical protein
VRERERQLDGKEGVSQCYEKQNSKTKEEEGENFLEKRRKKIKPLLFSFARIR